MSDRFNNFIEEIDTKKKRWADKKLTKKEIKDLKKYWTKTDQGQFVYLDEKEIQRVISDRDAAITKEKRLRLIKTIEDRLNCHLGPKYQNQIIYFSESFFREAGMNPSKAKKELIGLKGKIEHLLKNFESIHTMTRDYLNSEDAIQDDLFDRLQQELSKMLSRVKKKLLLFSRRKGGPNPNWALDRYVSYLGGVYERARERRPGRRGEFSHFVKGCLACLDYSNLDLVWLESTIDNSIRKYVDFMKSSHM